MDTVPFGAFKRELLALVGFFDETLLTNEDYEFNARIRKSGGKVWLDPSIRSVYFARATLSGLAKQYFRYGFWKWRMLRRYPNTLRWRQGLPPLFVLSLIGLGIAGIFLPCSGSCLAAEIIVYVIRTGCRGSPGSISNTRSFSLFLVFRLAISFMHISWGAGFLWSMISGSIHQPRPGEEIMRPLSRPRPNSWRVRPREQRTILLIGDLFVSVLALFGGLYFWGQKYDWLKFSLNFLKQRVELWFYFLPLIWMVFLVELYDLHRAKNLRQTAGGIAIAALTGIIILCPDLPHFTARIFTAFGALAFSWLSHPS